MKNEGKSQEKNAEISTKKHFATNLARKLCISTDWAEFYLTASHQKYINERTRLKGAQTSYYVSFCQFINQNTNGAIYFSSASKDTKLLTEDSFFSNCFLHFEQNGQCVQNRICSFKSKVVNNSCHGAHCFVDVSETSPFQNKIIDSSISNSGDKIGYSNMHCLNGALTIASTNVSYADIYEYEVCYMPRINSDSLIQFSTFSNNFQTVSSSCSYFESTSNANHNIKSCNYLNNRGGHTLIGCSNLILYASNCNFDNNTVSSDTFYHSGRGNATYDQCYFGNYQGKSGTVIVENTLNRKIDLILRHLSTFECYAVFPKYNHEQSIKIKSSIVGIIPLSVNMTLSQ